MCVAPCIILCAFAHILKTFQAQGHTRALGAKSLMWTGDFTLAGAPFALPPRRPGTEGGARLRGACVCVLSLAKGNTFSDPRCSHLSQRTVVPAEGRGGSMCVVVFQKRRLNLRAESCDRAATTASGSRRTVVPLFDCRVTFSGKSE